jgi:hypothetical protein
VSALGTAIYRHPGCADLLAGAIPLLFLPPPLLQGGDPLRLLLSALAADRDHPMLSLSSLHFLPRLFQALVDEICAKRHTIFHHASSIKSSYDVFILQKTRDTIFGGLYEIISLLDAAEDNKQDVEVLWTIRNQVWLVISKWGGYLETEESWGKLVESQSRRAAKALIESHGFGASGILSTLSTLEALDHRRTEVGPDILGWCLAVRAPMRSS